MKLFIPTIFLKNGQAVDGFRNPQDVLSVSPVELACQYRDQDADGILVFDFSQDDEEHEQNLDILKEICEKAEIPVYGAGNVKRMEDIKKILYTGCQKAVLNYGKAEGRAITQEVSLKFGKDKLIASLPIESIDEADQELLNQYVGSILWMNLEDADLSEKIPAYAPEGSEFSMLYFQETLALEPASVILRKPLFEAVCAPFTNPGGIRTMKSDLKAQGFAVKELQSPFTWDSFKKDSQGLVPVVVQDYKTDQVLMLAYMNREAYETTLRIGKMTYYSRSREELWIKGDTSGHYQYVKSLSADCDMDTILAKVSQVGAACHTGSYSCFFQEIAKVPYEEKNPAKILQSVYDVIADRKIHPREGSYTNYLFDKGIDKILKKCGEEATEIVIAAKNPNKNEVKYEISDFLYHCMVLMVEKGVTWEEITDDLAKR